MITALRVLVCSLTFIMSWSFMVGILIYGSALALRGFDVWIAPLWNHVLSTAISEFPSHEGLLYRLTYQYSAHAIPAYLVILSFSGGVIILVAHVLWQWVAPIGDDVRAAAHGFPVHRITPDTDIALGVANMAAEAGIRVPRLYLIKSTSINAFAISKPFRSAIAIHAGVMSLPPECVLWIIGHEMGHIRHGDTFPNMLRIATGSAAAWFIRLRMHILNLLFPIIARLPIIRMAVFPLELLLMGLFYCTSTAHRIAVYVFTLIDKACLRAVEYRADAFASTLVLPEYGIEVMKLFAIAETKGGLMRDHPSARKRMERLLEAASA